MTIDVWNLLGIPKPKRPARVLPAPTAPSPRDAEHDPLTIYLQEASAPQHANNRIRLLRVAAWLLGEAGPSTTPWELIRRPHITELTRRLKEHHTQRSTENVLYAVRGVLRVAHELARMNDAAYENAISLPASRGRTKNASPTNRSTNKKHTERSTRAANRRNAALAALVKECEITTEASARLRLADFDEVEKTLQVTVGKGTEKVSTPVPANALTALQNWLSVRGSREGPLLCSIHRHGRVTHQPIKRSTLRKTQRNNKAAEFPQTRVEEDKTRAVRLRNAAVMAVVHGCGIKETCIAGIQIAEFDNDGNRLRVKKRRTGQKRWVRVPPSARDALADWLEVRGDKDGPLLCTVNKSGTVTYRPMRTATIRNAVCDTRRTAEQTSNAGSTKDGSDNQ